MKCSSNVIVTVNTHVSIYLQTTCLEYKTGKDKTDILTTAGQG